jgi:predicted dehydrogenase
MEKICWGIIGCGDVTEMKSGPAFYKVPDSSLVAVMRRDAEKAADYARRHNVPRYYTSADELIHDRDVNAVYVATPPSSHEQFALAAMNAGKYIYVEKPLSLNAPSAVRIAETCKEKGLKGCVAHYRRAWPKFNKVKELLEEKAIGEIRSVNLSYIRRSLTQENLQVPKTAWRVDPAISGGGLFHDLAPHQLDLIHFFLGDHVSASGISINQEGLYEADDNVAAKVLFGNSVLFTGNWCFNADQVSERDHCMIIGSRGNIEFSFFGEPVVYLHSSSGAERFQFENPLHWQQPLISTIVQYFLGKADNPCPLEYGYKVMKLIDKITSK